jgi:signal transduction histidine kinase/CheY-like chemotaxis protein
MLLVLFFVFAIAIVALALLMNALEPRQQTIRIDLRASSTYVKQGFDPQSIEQNPAQTDGWTAVAGGSTQSLIAKDVLSLTSSRSFLDTTEDSDEDFTYAIPFWIDSSTLATIHTTPSIIPCIYLAGIGEGWEVYLNGNLVANELYRDDSGTVTQHRAWRSAALIVNPNLLLEGDNLLVFHIVGSPSGEYTGLTYRTPYYIGDYQSIYYGFDRLLTVIFCTIFIFMGFYHLLLFLMRRQDRYNLFYGLFSVCVGFYFFVRSPSVYLLIEDTAITQRLEYSLLYLLMFFALAFLETLNGKRVLWPTRIYGILCVVAIAATTAFSLQFADDLLLVWQYFAVLLLLYLISYDLAFVFFRNTYRTWKAKDKPRAVMSLPQRIRYDLARTALGNLFVVFIAAGSTMVYDLIDAAVLHTGILLTRYSFVFLTVCAAFILARQLTSNYEQASITNERLESLVQERTRELAEQVTIANKASQAKTEFMATMSHEIRTPMNAIIGLSSIELRREHPEPTRVNIQKINQSGINLLTLINEILDISKIEAGSFEIIPVDYHTVELVSESVQLNLVRIGEKPIAFELEVDAALPSTLNGDEIRIRQILNNLLSNAIKYTKSGTVRLTITTELPPAPSETVSPVSADKVRGSWWRGGWRRRSVRAASDYGIGGVLVDGGGAGGGAGVGGGGAGGIVDGGRVDGGGNGGAGDGGTDGGSNDNGQTVLLVIHVADTGQGIREEDREKLFEVFTQLDSRVNRSIEGTGLGLAITKRLVDLMGGSIGVQSEYGVGSTFSVRLPQQTTDPTPIGTEISTQLASLNFEAGYKSPLENANRAVLSPQTNILVVDDVPTNLEVVKGLLEPYRVNVDCVLRGALAVEAIRSKTKRYDLIFMDHMMPEMDGVEATRIIRKEIDSDYARRIPIVALTANATAGAAEMFLANGFDAFVSKPIDLKSFDDVLNRFLGTTKRPSG